MNQKKKEKYFWEKYFGISPQQAANLDPVVKKINFRESELNDEELGWLVAKVKVVHQLDLDYTNITDTGVGYLTRLDSIRELRLKGCKGISSRCLSHLAMLNSLELLHLGSTSVKIEEAAALAPLQNLKLLLLSSDQPQETIRKEVAALRQIFPGCEININHSLDY